MGTSRIRPMGVWPIGGCLSWIGMSPSISALHVTTSPRHWLDSAGGHPHRHQVCTLVCTDIHTNIISRCTHTYEPQNRHTTIRLHYYYPIGEGILKLSGLGFPIIPVVVVVVVNHGVYLVHYSRYLDETW